MVVLIVIARPMKAIDLGGIVGWFGGWGGQSWEAGEDLCVGLLDDGLGDGVFGPGEAEGLGEGRGSEVDVGGCLPACGADEGVGLDLGAGGEVDGFGSEVGDVVDVDLHFAFGDKVEEVGWGDHVVGQDGPEGVDDFAAEPGAVQEVADGAAAVGVAPDAGAEPGEEARGDELLEPFLQWGYVGRGHPDGAVAVVADDPVDVGAGGCGGVDGVPGRFGAAEDGDALVGLQDGVLVLGQVATVEERCIEGVLAGDSGHVGLGGDAGADDELFAHDGLLAVGVVDGQGPGPVGIMFRDAHARVQADELAELKVLDKALHVLLDHGARDMLAELDAERGVHGEVAELIGAQHVVGFEAGIQAVLGPDAADRGRALE
ncbi:unnamed protein product [Aspergillus oryzae var. brunneus]|uniref:Unnamed protein product n=2 Tax=Aspergillus oryzae TaxID=5062 RepID=A0AAN4YNK8_ASPOZ|nr:unnamed protein product [Aspergillus oryzae]GMG29933.1 unnamed protein product [Aspergillus oryzae]GMG46382.1 unnamed protein product [Aspergillus oryzae var. brunneus]